MSKEAIVGYTGTVGQNIVAQHDFEYKFNSSNFEESFGLNPDFLVFCGIPGSLFVANSTPLRDQSFVQTAFEQIKKINPKQLLLVSTISVYDEFTGNENSQIPSPKSSHQTTQKSSPKTVWGPYGDHRRWLELKVTELFQDHPEDLKIIRPGVVFGPGTKKNFLFDLKNPIPKVLNPKIFQKLSEKSNKIKNFYHQVLDDLYQLTDQFETDNSLHSIISQEFAEIGWNSTFITDSRSKFQLCPAQNIWNEIVRLKNSPEPIHNLISPPISASEIYKLIHPKEDFINEFPDKKPQWSDYQTLYPPIDDSKYTFTKTQTLDSINSYLKSAQ